MPFFPLQAIVFAKLAIPVASLGQISLPLGTQIGAKLTIARAMGNCDERH